MEDRSRKERKRANLQKAILGSLAIGGLLTVAAIAPSALGLLGTFGVSRKRLFPSKVSKSLQGLLDQSKVEFIGKAGHKQLRITDKGRLHLYSIDHDEFFRKKPKRWDGKWRVVIFDIAESKRATRDKIRFQLQALGFLRLQNSVWVYPHDCEDVVTLMKLDKRIGKAVLYMIVEQIEFDQPILEHFELLSRR